MRGDLRLELVIGDLLVSPVAGPNRARAIDFARAEIYAGATRAVVRERDRVPFGSSLEPAGYRVVVDVFVEFGAPGPRRDLAARRPARTTTAAGRSSTRSA